MIYVLLICLSILLIGSFILNKKDIISPSVTFCASFCFSCIWAAIYAKKWELELHSNTFFVIVGGVIEFVIISFFIQCMFSFFAKKSEAYQKVKLKKIEINSFKKISFLVFCILTFIYTIYAIVKVTDGNFGNIGAALDKYNSMLKFSKEPVVLPKVLNLFRYSIKGAGYWFIYVIINNYLVDKKIDFLSILIVIMSMACELATGSRGGAMNMGFAFVAIFFTLLNKKNNFVKSINFKTIILIVLIGSISLITFQTVGTLLGRKASSSSSVVAMKTTDYLAVYCGAEIKNLDMFLQEEHIKNNTIWGSQTFVSVIRWLGPRFGVKNYYYALDLPFRKVNGFSLGNVCTTFYPYIYDFGYFGEVVLVGGMAIIVQCIYEICKRKKFKNVPLISVLMYGYIYSSIILSFFSNKFYENTFTRNALIVIPISWIAYEILFCKIVFNKKDEIKYLSNNVDINNEIINNENKNS